VARAGCAQRLRIKRRQADRIRLFEHGTRFESRRRQHAASSTRSRALAAAHACRAVGRAKDMRGAADFYDVKSDLAALFAGPENRRSFTFEAGLQPARHPGRTARVLRCGSGGGWLGELHPTLVQALVFTYPPICSSWT